MFENIGNKIKCLAAAVAWLGIISSVIIGFIIMIPGDVAVLVGLIVAVIGSIASWLGSLFTYGFGELIDSTMYIAKKMGYTRSDNSKSSSFASQTSSNDIIDSKLKYKLNEDQSGYIINKSEWIYVEDVTIPSQYDNLPVTEIGAWMFYNNSDVRTVTIPNTIKKINTDSFSCCSKLNHIYFTGTRAEWDAIYKVQGWDDACSPYTVHCTDD